MMVHSQLKGPVEGVIFGKRRQIATLWGLATLAQVYKKRLLGYFDWVLMTYY